MMMIVFAEIHVWTGKKKQTHICKHDDICFLCPVSTIQQEGWVEVVSRREGTISSNDTTHRNTNTCEGGCLVAAAICTAAAVYAPPVHKMEYSSRSFTTTDAIRHQATLTTGRPAHIRCTLRHEKKKIEQYERDDRQEFLQCQSSLCGGRVQLGFRRVLLRWKQTCHST